MLSTNQARIVLVVEDEMTLLDIICVKLLQMGVETAKARTVEEAFNHLENNEAIGAIWLDHYLLGKEDGLNFLARLKVSERWKDLPVFVVSNTGSSDMKMAYLKLDVAEYFIKADHTLQSITEAVIHSLNKPVP